MARILSSEFSYIYPSKWAEERKFANGCEKYPELFCKLLSRIAKSKAYESGKILTSVDLDSTPIWPRFDLEWPRFDPIFSKKTLVWPQFLTSFLVKKIFSKIFDPIFSTVVGETLAVFRLPQIRRNGQCFADHCKKTSIWSQFLTSLDPDLTPFLVRKLEFFDTRFENKIAVKLLEEMVTNGMNLTELNMTNFFMFFHHLMTPQRETFDWVLFSRINHVVHLNYGVLNYFLKTWFLTKIGRFCQKKYF